LRADLRGCGWLVRLLPELSGGQIEPLPAWTVSPEQERRLVFEAVARFLANVAGPSGTLLVLDDLQWTGPDALDLLAVLARGAVGTSLRVVGSYRDSEVTPLDPLAGLLAELAGADLLTRVALGPLAPDDAARLLDALLDGATDTSPDVRQRALQRAGGTPFFLVSCTRALRGSRAAPDGEDTLPWNLTQSVEQRVIALPEGAREVLRVAAVAGRQAPRALLAAVVGRPEETVLSALEAACRARLLEELAEEDAFQFTHDVIREVIEAGLSAARRRSLHRQIAVALEQRRPTAGPEVLAYHYARSDVPDNAVVYLEEAGDKASAQSAGSAAEGYYRDLVEHLDRLGRSLDAARAREKLGTLLHMRGKSEAALDLYDQAARDFEQSGDRAGLLRTVAQLGWVHAVRGTIEEGLDRVHALVRRGEADAPTVGWAALYLALAQLYHHSAQYTDCLAASERAVALAGAAGDDWVRGRAMWERANTLSMLGRLPEGLPAMEEALGVLETTGDLVFSSIALDGLAEAHLHRGEFDTARRYITRGIEVAARGGPDLLIGYMIGISGVIDLLMGDWARARQHVEQALTMLRAADSTHMLAYPLSAMGWLCVAERRWDEASAALDEATSMAAPSGDLQALRWACRGLAELELLQGRPGAAFARLMGLWDRPGLLEMDVTPLAPLLAWAHGDLGDLDTASTRASAAVERARTQVNRVVLADALRIQAGIAAQQSRWDEAERALAEGLDVARAIGYRYAEARLLEARGRLHRQRGSAKGDADLAAARALFERFGASAETTRLARLLRQG
jgi:tetratricopeptide (TPR) repeat protein